MAMFVSKYLNLKYELAEKGIFDSILDEDSNYFINVKLLKKCAVPEFGHSYEKVQGFFCQIGTLLKAAESKDDKLYRTAYRMFNFSEVNGINLGFSASKYGAGFGKKLREKIVADAFEIIKKGSEYPEIFELVSLFEENVGPDRLSDMIARIIFDDIVSYTLRINKELGIIPDNKQDLCFEEGLVVNPYKGCPILLLPTTILHELPIARDWDDIDRVARENEAIKREINEVVCEQWKSSSSEEKKQYLREQVFMNPTKCARIVAAYNEVELEEYDILRNSRYNSVRIFEKIMVPCTNFESVNKMVLVNSYVIACEILKTFKHWVEYNGGSEILLKTDSRTREKVCQRLIHLTGKSFINTNGLDFSCEANEGRGPVDFKISRGEDKTVIEVKLSTNQQYLHGLQVQIEEYAFAENATSKIYVFVDLGNPGRLKTIKSEHSKMLNAGDEPAELFVIDATEKESASVY